MTQHRTYLLERVGDAAVVQVYADGFTSLPLREKVLIWHLYLATLAGRDIYYDQRYAHNLEMRDVLEEIITHSQEVDPRTLQAILNYTKLFWLNTGPYNNLTARKFVLACTPEAFAAAAAAAQKLGARFPFRANETLGQMLTRLQPMFFDAGFQPILTNSLPGSGSDALGDSANNLYVNVRMKDLDDFIEAYTLNSRLVKTDDGLVEEVYRLDGKYGEHLTRVVQHLEAAMPYASESTAAALAALVQFYRTGVAGDRCLYDIAWVQDDSSSVHFINGFVEVYLDPRRVKGSWEGFVSYLDQEKAPRIHKLAATAQWFEDRMPWDPRYRKSEAKGIAAYAIDVVVGAGNLGPITPLGINLPNDEAIRERYGSKSFQLLNVCEAYDKSMAPAFRREFAWSTEEALRAERWSGLATELMTNMHEVIGHASGRVSERLRGTPQAALKEHFIGTEEARADLVALYFLPSPKLVELGLIPAESQEEIVITAWETFARNALVQLRRVRTGSQIEDSHMRARQMIVHWLMHNTEAVAVRKRDGKTHYVMVDANAFHAGVARLLGEVQRIKAEGDCHAAERLFDTYGVHFDPKLRDEVVARVDALSLWSYVGFVQPRLEAVRESDGTIVDVKISYPQDLTAQMLEYSGRHIPRVTTSLSASARA